MTRAAAIAAVAALAIGSVGTRAFGDPPGGDGAPAGMVAFFNGATCPGGWTRATYAEGRLILGVTSGVFVGVTVGAPLASAEDRAHAHTFAAAMQLAVKSISAAGGGNNSAAAAMAYPAGGTTGAAPSGLPFI